MNKLIIPFCSLAMLAGCMPDDGSDGNDGTHGYTAFVIVNEEPAGENCEAGGNKIISGIDTNQDGKYTEMNTQTLNMFVIV